MFSATRRWLRRNRTPLAIGAGVVGAGYVVTQYVLGKINDARERMSSDRVAKENLRRRFEQNQEDCTFTVLALLPTATTNIIETMNTEQITYQIQKLKTRPAGSAAGGEPTGPPSIADTSLTDEDGRSMASLQSESGLHASQFAFPGVMSGFGSGSDIPGAGQDSCRRKTKRQLWDELAISSISRACTLLYTLALLAIFTRIQLNLLGRRNYLSSVVSLATGSAQAAISLENNDDDNHDQTYGSDFDINRRYLTFSWWLLNRGWRDLSVRVEAAVRAVFGHLSPRDELSPGALHDLARQVRALVEKGSSPGSNNWLPLLLPPVESEEAVLRDSGVLGDSAAAFTQPGTGDRKSAPPAVAAALRRLLDETSDLIESPAFTHVLSLLLDAGFSTLLDEQVAHSAFGGSQLEEKRLVPAVQLPRILSVLTRQAHVIGSGVQNLYLERMEAVRDLEAFAAVVYSSNWQNEMRHDDPKACDPDVRGSLPAGCDPGVMDSAVLVSALDIAQEQPVSASASLESAWERAVGQS